MQDDWFDWLAPGEFAYNNRSHSSTGHSPFYLDHGRHPRTPLTIDCPDSSNPAANTFLTNHQDAQSRAEQALLQAAETMKYYADCKRKQAPTYKEGQQVWLDIRNLKTGRPSKKFDVRRTGPFTILEKITPLAYRLQLPLSWKIHPVFHVSLL